MRKLASIQRILDITPIEKADNIECVTVNGWQLVAKKGEFLVNDLCVYFEIDSFLPDKQEFAFLKDLKTHQGKQGYRLRTIKLRGQISQGLALPLSTFNLSGNEGDDVTELLGVFKYDNSVIEGKQGTTSIKAAGRFPSFIPKTDEERIQNLMSYFTKHRDTLYEETLKLDGSSCTMYKIAKKPSLFDRFLGLFGRKVKDYHFGVCSRNLEIKPGSKRASSFDNSDGKISLHEESNFWKIANRYSIEKHLPIGYAIQGELIGPKIQSNHEKVDDIDFYIFNIYDINADRYLTPDERFRFRLDNLFLSCKHVPIINRQVAIFQECPTLADLLIRVKGPSMNSGTISEGRVYKALDGSHSFKCINNDYLLKCEQ